VAKQARHCQMRLAGIGRPQHRTHARRKYLLMAAY
jgi:hypothetical protein